MDKIIKYSLLGVLIIALTGGGYYFFTQLNTDQVVSIDFDSPSEMARKQNQAVFNKLGVEYLRNIKIITPIAKSVDAKKSNRYASSPLKYDMLEKKYGEQIAQGHIAPILVKFIDNHVGYGTFAAEDIKKGDLAGEYTGRVINKEDLKTSKYSWVYPLKHDKSGAAKRMSLDASEAGNEMRFVNHDSNPNVRMESIPQGGDWHVVYIATRDIPKGGQVLTSYGTGYWKTRGFAPREFVKEEQAAAQS